jgi:hypothetical protein
MKLRLLHRRALWLALAASLVATGAQAHDTWLSPVKPPTAGQDTVLDISTGNRYPTQEFGATLESIDKSACVDGQGRSVALRPTQATEKWTQFRARPASPAQGLACWVEIRPFEIELQPNLIEVYLAEIRASAALRATWADLASRKLPWLESFRKFARIELAENRLLTAEQRVALRKPAGLALELVLLGTQPVAVGEELEFQVLRDGQPLPGFQVELQTAQSPLGIWRETDAQGKLRHRLPFAGRWLLRGTDLRLAPRDPTRWESRFVTLALDVKPAQSPPAGTGKP